MKSCRRKVVEGLQEIQAKHEGVCKGCVKGKNTKKKFPSSESKDKGILEIIHFDVWSLMSSSSLSREEDQDFFDQTMAENSHQMNSRNYAKIQGLRGCWPLHIIHNKMGLQKEKIERSLKLQEQCFMIKIYRCIFRLKLPEQWCMCRTVLHIECSRTRLLKKSSLARNQKSAISEYSAVPCTCTFQKKRELN